MSVTHKLIEDFRAIQLKLAALTTEHANLKTSIDETIEDLSNKLDQDNNYNPFRAVALVEQSILCNGQPFQFNIESRVTALESIMNTFSSIGNRSVNLKLTSTDKSQEVYSKLFNDMTDQKLPPYKTIEAREAVGRILRENVKHILGLASFPDKFLKVVPLARGETGRIEVKNKSENNPQLFVTADPNTLASQIRQAYIFPPEFYTNVTAVMSDREFEQSPISELFEELLKTIAEGTVLGLNTAFVKLIRTAASKTMPNSLNPVQVSNGNFSPSVATELRKRIPIADPKNTRATLLLSQQAFAKMVLGTTDFLEYWEPPANVTAFTWGDLGKLYGMRMQTDPLAPEYKTLNPEDAFILGEPTTLGAMTLRKDFDTKYVDRYSQGIPEVGWYGERIQGMAISDCSSLVSVSFA